MALKAWKKIKPTGELYTTILASVKDNVQYNQQWQKESGRYIPNPYTWLNQMRWLDEIPVPLDKSPDEQSVASSGYSQELLDRLAGGMYG